MPSHFALERHRADGLDRPMVHLPCFVTPVARTGRSQQLPRPARPYFLYVGRLEKLKGEIKENKRRSGEAQRKEASVLQSIEDVDQQLKRRREELGKVTTRLKLKNHELDATSSALSRVHSRIEERQESNRSRLRVMYKTGPGTDMRLLLGSRDSQDLMSRLAMLRTARSALAPGGRLAFETRNPLARAWEQWTPAAPPRRLSSAEEGDVEVTAHLRSVRGAFVDGELHYRFTATGEELVSRQVLRFPTRDEVLGQLTTSGFSPEVVYGDWDGSPFSEPSPEIIFVAR